MWAMSEIKEDTGATRARFEEMFTAMARAMEVAASKSDHSEAASVAEGLGLKETSPSASTGATWQTTENGLTLWFQWRYYDQSHSFRVQRDMNILSLELREGEKIVRQAQERFED